MDSDVLLKNISENGYMTKDQILKQASSDKEIVEMTLNFFEEKGQIKKITYDSVKGPGELYYLIYKQ